ncbi:probable serine/threonine-protein kinase clkA [Phymastichus coffea]|uniref:probable serine/threonine-protein kinase clkA n=1 Tax=Phymastichus coffea TaxID=108790 RepID=UPI00273BAD4C|nr:probable serine/threonine-protein kinase clkA [Phymastichus coffea]XP_058806527.1 probable serine/threonine-protein kinase clkA [Phymastichus coffea]
MVAAEDQQANNVTLSSTAQKRSTWINASTSSLMYNNVESSGKFFLKKEKDSTTSYDDSLSSILPGNFNQTFTIADNEASGNNSNETFARDNEDESYRNEAIHADSKEKFQQHKQPPLDQDVDPTAKKFFKLEDEIVDVPKNDSIEIDGNSTTDEHDEMVENFLTNENSEALNDTVSEHDDIVDHFFANEEERFSVSEFLSKNWTKALSEENDLVGDKFVDDFFANENESFSVSDFVNSNSTETLSGEDSSADKKFVDAFFANESEDLSGSGIGVMPHLNEVLDESQNNNTTSERHELVDDFFASENENLNSNGIGSEESNKDFTGTFDDKPNNNNTTSSEFNSTKSPDDGSSNSSVELTLSMEHFFSNENENSTNWKDLTSNIESENSTISQEDSLTKSSTEWFDEANVTSSEIAQVANFSNDSSSSELCLSKLENSTEILDSSELVSSKEFIEVTISNEDKNATAAQPRTYANETAAPSINRMEDRSTKYADTGDRNRAGHAPSSSDDLFKETTTAAAPAAAMTTASLDDWGSTIALIESHADEKVSEEAATVQRRRRNILMTFQGDEASVDVASAGKLRAPEATSSSVRLVNGSTGAWESSRMDSSPITLASSRNRPSRIITSEMNKGSAAELQRQYRTFLLSLRSRQTQFAEKRDSLGSQAWTKKNQ